MRAPRARVQHQGTCLAPSPALPLPLCPLSCPQLLAIPGAQLCLILLPWDPTDWLPDLLLCPLTGRLLWHLSGQLPQACPASVSAHSPRYGRPSPALPLVTSCHRFLSVWFVSPPKLALLSGTGAFAGNSGLEESTSKDSHNTSLAHCPVLGRGPLAFPLGHSAIPPLLLPKL